MQAVSANVSTLGLQQPQAGRCSPWVAVVLFLATCVLYLPVMSNDFVAWDDQLYVYEEPGVLNGISPAGLGWALTANVCANWHPLTVMSLQLDAELFGPTARGFHRTAMLLHALNAVLAYWALSTLTGCPWRSALVAALFAWHPVRVESVAWISERKGLLSGSFFFLTLIAYAHYVRAPAVWRYLLVCLSLAFGLCAKSILVTTPCVLWLLDFWPLRRCKTATSEEGSSLGKVILEKIPLLGLSALASGLTSMYQQNAMLGDVDSSLSERPENFARACLSYLGQTFFPTRLTHFYPFPVHSSVLFISAVSLLLTITVLSLWQWRRRPYLLVGWLWFLGMLVPVSGLIQVGFQQRADRYLYLSQIGILLGIVWGISDLVQSRRLAQKVMLTVFAFFLVACGVLTTQQIGVWKNTETLWKHAYACDPRNPPAVFSLMEFAFKSGESQDAVRFADELIQLEDRKRHQFLLRVYEALATHGEYEAGIRAMNRALEFGANFDVPPQELYFRRGESFAALGRWPEAVQDYQQMLKLSPNVVPLWFCLAHALAKNGQVDASVQLTAAALQRLPQFPESAVASAWKTSTDPDSTGNQLFKALCLAEHANAITGGRQARYLDVLAAAYAANGQFDQAIATAKQALANADVAVSAGEIQSRLELYEKHQRFVLDRSAPTGQ